MSENTEENGTLEPLPNDIVEEENKEPTVPTSKNYQYFDTPNGEDVGKKLWYALNQVSHFALAVGTVDIFLYSKPKKILHVLGRYAWTTLPIFGVTTAFVLTTNFAKIYRNKEDYWNYAIGGYAGGAIVATYKGRATSGWFWGTILTLCAINKKNAIDNNYTIFPIRPQVQGSISSIRSDYSLIPYRPGNYTVGPSGSVGPEE